MPHEEVDPKDFHGNERLVDDYETENSLTFEKRFSDKVRVWVSGGTGGMGACSYERFGFGTKTPDGGDGGRGGDVFFRGSQRLSSLQDLKRAHFKGNPGTHGRG